MVKVNLTDEDLAERNTNYFSEGEHEVAIVKAERGTTDAGKEYVEFTVQGKNEEEGTARLWFTTDASAKYALSIMAGIAVHNKDTDAEKAKVREAFKAIQDTDVVDDKFLKKFENMLAFYQVSKSDRTYMNAAGETKNSYDRNIYGYMPKPKAPSAEATAAADLQKPVDVSDIPF